ncbi:hypothetical protein DL546_009831 [Coniochaeta pulveracea]|uniref:Uncharacterized protein n=1 Tax=Coniochaeta pulveracea TaxID=177199 RepID=A0A420YPF5_9PEZI|nr:hypothetical protein DL546_009831 [Coniochaeta pulveracea]
MHAELSAVDATLAPTEVVRPENDWETLYKKSGLIDSLRQGFHPSSNHDWECCGRCCTRYAYMATTPTTTLSCRGDLWRSLQQHVKRMHKWTDFILMPSPLTLHGRISASESALYVVRLGPEPLRLDIA